MSIQSVVDAIRAHVAEQGGFLTQARNTELCPSEAERIQKVMQELRGGTDMNTYDVELLAEVVDYYVYDLRTAS